MKPQQTLEGETDLNVFMSHFIGGGEAAEHWRAGACPDKENQIEERVLESPVVRAEHPRTDP